MLRKSGPTELLNQRFLSTLLSCSLTTFLLGGVATYWAVAKWSAPIVSTEGAAARPAGKGKPPARAQLVRVGTIQRQSIVPVKALVGDLIAVRSATIATEVAGKLVALPIDEGTEVIAGKTLIARIDDTWTNLERDKIMTQIAEKKATLAFETTDLKRYEELLGQRAVSLSEAEQKRSLIEGLQASLAQLNVLLKEANERISRREIYAPFDGSVVAKHTEVGEYLPIGSPIVEIISNGRIDARMMVPENSLPLLSTGDSVDVVVDSLGLELSGKVFSINAQGSVGSRTFPVRVELDDRNGKLLPGMGVTVFVPVMQKSTELLVPRDAVLMQPDESTVWILEPKEPNDASKAPPDVTSVSNGGTPHSQPQWVAHPVPVQVLSHTRQSYAITCQREADRSRLAPGVQVVTEGLERLVPGALVRVDSDSSSLESVPGAYRTGQQRVDR